MKMFRPELNPLVSGGEPLCPAMPLFRQTFYSITWRRCDHEHSEKSETLLETLSVYYVGRQNQIKSGDLARLFELESKQIQELVHTLRHEGYPICGDRDG